MKRTNNKQQQKQQQYKKKSENITLKIKRIRTSLPKAYGLVQKNLCQIQN